MSNLIHIKDFVFINKRFLDKDDNLEILTNLDSPKPCSIYLNGNIYEDTVSLQSDIPFIIPNSILEYGYNEIKITADVNILIIFGITNGYRNGCNIIEYENCQINLDENKAYINGGDPSTITIKSAPDNTMNKILNIPNVFGDNITPDNIYPHSLGPIGSDKLYYEDILGGVDSIIPKPELDVSKFRYFRIEISSNDDSESKYFRPLDINGNTFIKEPDLFAITDHNFETNIIEEDSFIFESDESITAIGSIDNMSYFELTSTVPIYGFSINHISSNSIKIYGKENVEDDFIILINMEYPNIFDAILDIYFDNSYITAFEYDNNVYVLNPSGTEPYLVSFEEYDQIQEAMKLLPPIPDSYIEAFIENGTANINDISVHISVQSLELKSDDIEYGIAIKLGDNYFDSLGGLSEDIYLFNYSDIDIQQYPSSADIVYYVKSEFPIAINIKEYPYASYFIKNKINIKNFNLSTANIHDNPVTMSAYISNDFNIKMRADVYMNNRLMNSIFLETPDTITEEYDYSTPHIRTGQNDINIIVEDTLGYSIDSDKIIFIFTNNGPTISLKVHDFYIVGTVNDLDKDKVNHIISINDELVSYNNPFRDVPYTFKYEWDNFKYNPGDKIAIEVQVNDEYGASSIVKTNKIIVDKGLIIFDNFNRQITNQKMENIVEFNIGSIISNNPPDNPFKFKIKNMTGYDLYNISIINNTKKSDPPETVIEMAILDDSDAYKYFRNTITIPNMEAREEETILFNIDGLEASGKLDAKIILSIYANIRNIE